jgi:hypothetical protein
MSDMGEKIEGERKRGQEEKKKGPQRETGDRVIGWGIRVGRDCVASVGGRSSERSVI